MNVPTKLAAFSVLLVAIFVAALGLGTAVGPIDLHSSSNHTDHGSSAMGLSRTAVIDGYTITFSGELLPRTPSPLTFTVAKDGRPITDLAPYRGAYGHLEAVRSGDLTPVSVFLKGEPGDGTTTGGPSVEFTATVPSDGSYRLYMTFFHDGHVHTAEFTSTAGDPSTAPPADGPTTTFPADMHDHGAGQ